MTNEHTSVLLREALEQLAVRASDTVVDATVGGAGHFSALLEQLGPEGTLVGIDADPAAIARAQALLEERAGTPLPTVHLVQDNFRNLNDILARLSLSHADRVLFDLGWSGYQLSAGRGFSFQKDEPLHMTYGNPEGRLTASDLVNTLGEQELADIFYSYGEERFARSIARAIVAMREQAPIETTYALVAAVRAGTPAWYQRRRVHPATKVFQALRIAVNDELDALRDALSAALSRVPEEGRIAVITFHSIEDRIVKSFFRDAVYAGRGTLVNRKPLAPSSAELAANPRARSAKLRVFEREDVAPKSAAFIPSVSLYV